MAIGVVVDIQPVAPLEPVAVERQLQLRHGVGDEERDELLRVLPRTVGVGPRVTTTSSP